MTVPRFHYRALRFVRRIGVVCCLSLCLGATPAFPHANSVSYSNITIDATGLTYNLLTYIHDLWQIVWLDSNNDGVVDDAEVLENKEVILDYLREKIQVFDGDRLYEPELVGFATVVDTSFGFSQIVGVDLDFRYDMGDDWEGLQITCNLYDEVDFQHQSFAVITYGDQSEEFVFFLDNVFDVSEMMQGIWADARYFFTLGLVAMFTSVEHLVFLLGFLVVTLRLANAVKGGLAFVLALSATLWLSATDMVVVDTRFVEVAVGVTIAYIGFENFFVKNDDWRWLLTGFFGLIHGFSLSLTLRYLGLSPEEEHLAIGLYAAGVWLAAGGFLLSVYAVFSWCRRFFWYLWVIRKGQSLAVVLLGAAWCYERYSGVSLLHLQGPVRVLVVLLLVEALFILAPLRFFGIDGPEGATASSPAGKT